MGERKRKHRFLGFLFVLVFALIFSCTLQCSKEDKSDKAEGSGNVNTASAYFQTENSYVN